MIFRVADKDERCAEAGTCGTINLERSNFHGSGFHVNHYMDEHG